MSVVDDVVHAKEGYFNNLRIGSTAKASSASPTQIVVSQDNTGDYQGSTHTAIQSAITYAIANSIGKVFIKRGTYTISTKLTCNGHLIIEGEGPEFTELKAGNSFNGNMLEINSTQSASTHYRVVFRDIKFDGNHTNQTTGSCVVSYGGIQGEFFHCHFENFYNYGLHLWDCQGGSGAFGHHNQIIDCLFDQGETSAGEGIGLYIRNNDENSIISSQFQYNKIGIKDESGFNQITSCAFVDGEVGVYVLDSSRTRINSCIFDYCARQGIHLKAPFNLVNGCTFYRCSDGSSTYDCLYIDYYGHNLISNNVFVAENSSNKTRTAIYEDGNNAEDTEGNNMILGNFFLSTSTSTTMQGSSNWSHASGGLFYVNSDNTLANNIDSVS